jgi:prostatic aicd phosphatase
MSLQLVLAGFFPPKQTLLEWNKELNWQPIPYHYQELNDDDLLLVRKSCPRYYEELHRVMNEDFKSDLERESKMMEELTNFTGIPIKTPDDVQSLYSTLKAEVEFPLELPSWTKEYFPHRMQNLTDWSYVINAYNGILKRLKGGVFVKKALSDWKLKIADKLRKKIFIYAGHDATVTNILSAFNAWEVQFPNYGVTGILELSMRKDTGNYGIQIFLKNSPKNELKLLKIKGCDEFCELSKLENLLSDNIPQNWEQECKPIDPNFTTPASSGP